jgi:transposase
MMVIGVDPREQSHTAVAADELGRKKAQKTVRAGRGGHRELIAWAREIAPAGRLQSVEDVRHVAGGLIRDLLAAGESVVFVPPKLMAGERRGGRERGKSDPIDALAVARLALREGAALPAARLDAQVLEVRRLTDYRDDLVAERTRAINSLRWLIHDLDPELAPPPRALAGARARARLAAGLAALPGSAGRRIALSGLARITALTGEISALEDDLETLVRRLAPALLDLTGVAVITAAKILGETGDIRRFRSTAASLRALKRHLSDAVYRALSTDAWRLDDPPSTQLDIGASRRLLTASRTRPFTISGKDRGNAVGLPGAAGNGADPGCGKASGLIIGDALRTLCATDSDRPRPSRHSCT